MPGAWRTPRASQQALKPGSLVVLSCYHALDQLEQLAYLVRIVRNDEKRGVVHNVVVENCCVLVVELFCGVTETQDGRRAAASTMGPEPRDRTSVGSSSFEKPAMRTIALRPMVLATQPTRQM